MLDLENSSYSVDESSGAVFFHRSPELKELMQLREEVKNLNNKVDKLLEIIEKGGD